MPNPQKKLFNFSNNTIALIVVFIYIAISLLFGPNHGSIIGQAYTLEFSKLPIIFWILFAFNISFLGLIVLKNKDMFDKNVVLIGGLFLFVDSWFSYQYFQSNSFKLLTFYVFVLFLSIFYLKPKLEKASFILPVFFLLMVHPLTTLPGAILNGFNNNYNFTYEFASLFPLAVYGSIIYYLYKEEKLNLLIKWFSLAMIVVTFWAFKERIFDFNVSNYGTRSKSTFGNPTYYSTYIAVIGQLFIAFFVYKFIELKNKNLKSFFYVIQKNWLIFSGLLFSIIGQYLSGTRAGQLGFLIGATCSITLVLFIFFRKKFFKYFSIIILIVISLLFLLVFLYYIFDKDLFEHLIFVFNLEAYFNRLNGWIPAIDAFLDKPLFGHGLGSSYNLYFQYFWEKSLLFYSETSYNHVHNEILELAEEGGLFALFGIFGFIFGVITLLLKVSLSKSTSLIEKIFSVFFIGSIVAYYIDSIFSISQRQMAARVPFYIVLGLSLALIDKRLKLFEKLRKLPKRIHTLFLSNYFRLIVIFTLFIWNGVYISRWLYSQYYFVESLSLPLHSSIEKMKSTLPVHRDIYLLYFLTTRLYSSKQFTEYIKYLNVSLDTISSYRNIYFKISDAYLLLGDFNKAYQNSLKYFQKNPYYVGNFMNLMNLSIHLNEEESFYEALKSGLTFFLFGKVSSTFDSKIKFADTEFKISPILLKEIKIELVKNQTNMINLSFKKGIFLIRLNDQFYNQIRQDYIANSNIQEKVPNQLQSSINAAIKLKEDVFLNDYVYTNEYSNFTTTQKIKSVENVDIFVKNIGRLIK